MLDNFRELNAKAAITILILVLLFAIVYGGFMYYQNHETIKSEIEVADLQFSIDDNEYNIYSQFGELMKNPNVVIDPNNKKNALKPGETTEILVTVHTAVGGVHSHPMQVYIKNTSDNPIDIRDATIYKLEIDLRSIEGDVVRDDCGIHFFKTSIAQFRDDKRDDVWTDRFGTPQVKGSFETREYVWEKPIKFTDAKLVLTREFGEHRFLSIEIQNIDSLFVVNEK